MRKKNTSLCVCGERKRVEFMRYVLLWIPPIYREIIYYGVNVIIINDNIHLEKIMNLHDSDVVDFIASLNY